MISPRLTILSAFLVIGTLCSLLAASPVSPMPPTISITEPTNGASFNVARINVSGHFTGESIRQISVNGMPAFIGNATFETANVFLRPGANTISVVITDSADKAATNSITIMGPTDTNAYLVDPVQLMAAPVGGFAPLTVTFQVKASVPGEIRQVLYDFNGNHVIDKKAHDLRRVTYTYTDPGERFPVVTLETTAGRFSSLGWWSYWLGAPMRINVQAPPVVLQTLQVPDPVDIKTAGSNLYVLSGSTGEITEFHSNEGTIRSLGNIGRKPTGFDVDRQGNIYVALSASNQVSKFKPTANSFEVDGSFNGDGFIGNKDGSSGAGSNELNAPFDIVVEPHGFYDEDILVSDSGNNRIQQFSGGGWFLHSFSASGSDVGQFNRPKGLASDGIGREFIVDSGNNRVIVGEGFAPMVSNGGAGAALGQFKDAMHIAVGKRGICVADTGNNRVQIFDPLRYGEATRLTLDPRVSISAELGLKQPQAAAWVDDPLREKLYIADTGNNRVILVELPLDNPEAVWNALKQHLLAGDIDGALSYYAGISVENARESFSVSANNE